MSKKPKAQPQLKRFDSDEDVERTPIPSDYSIHPSYSKLKPPYRVVCRERYKASRERYKKQFLYELKQQEAMQTSAYDAMRFNRHFAITTLWPPLHTRKEIELVLKHMYTLTPKQQKRLRELLDEPQY